MFVINREHLIREKKVAWLCIFVGILIFITLINQITNIVSNNSEEEIFDIILMILFNFTHIVMLGMGILSIYMGRRGIKLVKGKNEKYKILEKNGRLIRKVPCYVEEKIVRTHNRHNTSQYHVVVDYVLPDGKRTKLYCNKIYYDAKKIPADVIDILIDPLDYSNYFIDFEIKEIK